MTLREANYFYKFYYISYKDNFLKHGIFYYELAICISYLVMIGVESLYQ